MKVVNLTGFTVPCSEGAEKRRRQSSTHSTRRPLQQTTTVYFQVWMKPTLYPRIRKQRGHQTWFGRVGEKKSTNYSFTEGTQNITQLKITPKAVLLNSL